jgi:hypothetical protein
MRVPSIPYRDPPAVKERDDRVLLTLFGASLLLSALIWGLAIAKAIDFYASS